MQITQKNLNSWQNEYNLRAGKYYLKTCSINTAQRWSKNKIQILFFGKTQN